MKIVKAGLRHEKICILAFSLVHAESGNIPGLLIRQQHRPVLDICHVNILNLGPCKFG